VTILLFALAAAMAAGTTGAAHAQATDNIKAA
jgi:hypothetical protein